MLIVFFVLMFFSSCFTGIPADPGNEQESFGYLPVRPDASIFYWLMLASNATHDYESFPLVIALAGGPGDGSSGFTNFEEIGPFDLDGNVRNNSWLRHANLLFIDLPVGSGYSFVDEGGMFCSSGSCIGKDFVEALKQILLKYPMLQTMPTYIFGESYGGRYAATGAKMIHDEVRNNGMNMNLRGIGLASAWISPIDTMRASPEYLYSFSLIDEREKMLLSFMVDEMEYFLKSSQDEQAFFKVRETAAVISNMTFGIASHNVLQPAYNDTKLLQVMNSRGMKDKLKIPDNVSWRGQIDPVRQSLKADFVYPVTEDVEFLLNETDIKVIVYNGQLDLTCCMTGSERWISHLKWKDAVMFTESEKELLLRHPRNHLPLVYRKRHGQLSLYFFMKAGHLIPMDQPEAARLMLLDVIG